MVLLSAVAFFITLRAQSDAISFSIAPQMTDPQIQTFTNPHWMYVNRNILIDHQADLPQDRRQLLLWLTGTGGKAHEAQAFLTLAANLGYRVISLMYPDEVPASVCDGSSDPHAFERFRMAIIEGGQMSPNGRGTFAINRPESIENRLVKLLQRLSALRPRENWGQFLNTDGSIRWESISVAGQSQGGGHAALLGIKHRVARVICFGAPKDYSIRLGAPAAWYSEESATPKDRFFAFNHHEDPKGCTPAQLLQNLKTLQLDKFGPVAEVDSDSFPYGHSRVFYTNFPSVTVTRPDDQAATVAHTTGIDSRNAARWQSVWTYLLTEPTS